MHETFLHEKYRLKRRNVLKWLGLTTVSLSTQGSEFIIPKDEQNAKRAQKEKLDQLKAVEVIKHIYDLDEAIPGNLAGSDEIENKILKEQAIRIDVEDTLRTYAFGLRLKSPPTNTWELVTESEMKYAIVVLMLRGKESFVAKFFGNKDGTLTSDKWLEWNNSRRERLGLGIVSKKLIEAEVD